MKIVSIINYKGGVGKTSLTANLGAELAWKGKNVLLIDLDPQASLTFSFIRPDEWSANYERYGTIKSWFDAYDSNRPIGLEDLIHSPERISDKLTNRGNLDVIYSHLGLINVDLELATKLGGANLQQAKRNFISVHRRLLDGLSRMDPNRYDVVLIDCPPNFNIVTKTALIASDYMLVPTRPDELSTLGIDYLIRSIDLLIRDYNDYVAVETDDMEEPVQPAIVGIVFTMIQEYAGNSISAQQTYMERVRRDAMLPVFENYIKRNDTLFAGAPEYGVPVVLSTHNNYSHQSVVDGLQAVADEFERMIRI